jgi:hypothetical protein
MMRGLFSARRLVGASVCVLVAAGCGPGDDLTVALKAEKSGHAGRAFDAYYNAAARSPSSGRAEAGMRRVRGRAAADAESEALRAMREERYADGWLLLMRALDIRPDHPEAPRMIRDLEYDHPTAVEPARQRWIRDGWNALALGPAPAAPTVQVADAAPAPRGEAMERLIDTADEPDPVEAEAKSDSESETEPKPAPERPLVVRAKREVILPWSPAYESPERTTRHDDGNHDPAPTVAPSKKSPSHEAMAARRPVPRSPFVAVYTLSKRDNRYPRSVVAIDDLRIRLEDTDDDLEVDLDLYIGRRRVKKVREIKIGQSEAFFGRSGRRFRLTLIAIHHPTRTARIGIVPAS